MSPDVSSTTVLYTGLFLLSATGLYGWMWATIAVGKTLGNQIGYDSGLTIGASTYFTTFMVLFLNGALITGIGIWLS